MHILFLMNIVALLRYSAKDENGDLGQPTLVSESASVPSNHRLDKSLISL